MRESPKTSPSPFRGLVSCRRGTTYYRTIVPGKASVRSNVQW
jgi:hypothetical protein